MTLSRATFDTNTGNRINLDIERYKRHYQVKFNENTLIRERKMDWMQKNRYEQSITDVKNANYNESLADLVKNVSTKERMLEHKGQLIQQINPVFQDPLPTHFLDYRTAFFVPKKVFAGVTFSTFAFDLLIVWLMSFMAYLTLYWEVLRKGIGAFGKVNFPRKK